MKIEGDSITFSTGRTEYTHQVGIALLPNGDIYELWSQDEQDEWDELDDFENQDEWPDEEAPLTKQERLELAEYMIAEWTKVKDRITK